MVSAAGRRARLSRPWFFVHRPADAKGILERAVARAPEHLGDGRDDLATRLDGALEPGVYRLDDQRQGEGLRRDKRHPLIGKGVVEHDRAFIDVEMTMNEALAVGMDQSGDFLSSKRLLVEGGSRRSVAKLHIGHDLTLGGRQGFGIDLWR